MIYLCQSSGKQAGGSGGCWCGSSCCSQPPICQAAGARASSWAHRSSPWLCGPAPALLRFSPTELQNLILSVLPWNLEPALGIFLSNLKKYRGSTAAGHCKNSPSLFLLVILNCKMSVCLHFLHMHTQAHPFLPSAREVLWKVAIRIIEHFWDSPDQKKCYYFVLLQSFCYQIWGPYSFSIADPGMISESSLWLMLENNGWSKSHQIYLLTLCQSVFK